MVSTHTYALAREVADAIAARVPRTPRLCLVLGSGLGAFVDTIEDKIVLPYEEIPGFPSSSVVGHAGNLVFGRVANQDIVVMQGRTHYYESGDMDRVALAARIMRLLGAEIFFVTNSSGGVSPSFAAGDLMVITDHINMMGRSPLIGPNDERFGPRFPDMTEAYDKVLSQHVVDAAEELGIPVQQGVYAAFFGPAYETPAEIRMARIIGADAVGMSTVPEVLVANHMGMRCVGISCISNLAAGISENKLTHDEVMETAALVSAHFVRLVSASLQRILS